MHGIAAKHTAPFLSDELFRCRASFCILGTFLYPSSPASRCQPNLSTSSCDPNCIACDNGFAHRPVVSDSSFSNTANLVLRREAFGRDTELNRPANMVKQKGRAGRAAKDGGEDLSGVAQFSSREELYSLAG